MGAIEIVDGQPIGWLWELDMCLQGLLMVMVAWGRSLQCKKIHIFDSLR